MVSCVVIDEEFAIIEMFTELLEMSNIKVLASGNKGSQAVELYEKFKPDVLFIDPALSTNDGKDAIKKIRSLNPIAKIIVLTSESESASHLCESLMADHVLRKPFNMRSVRECVTVALLNNASNQK